MEWITAIASIALSVCAAIATSFLTLGKYQEKVDQLENHDKEHGEELRDLCMKVAVLDERTQNIQKSIDSLASAAQAHSPIQLTPQGWKMVKDNGAHSIFEDNRDKHLEELEAQKPHSQYSAQEKVYRIMSNKFFNAKEFQPIEQWVFNNRKNHG